MFKINEFCPLCFHIIHVLSIRPNPVRAVLRRPLAGPRPGQVFRPNANFPHFDRIFLYIPCLARVILVPMSFGPVTFNGQDPPLFMMLLLLELPSILLPGIWSF
ncbi:hypothetical protein Hanom_Chr15g01404081 [Helianthus anomalus]